MGYCVNSEKSIRELFASNVIDSSVVNKAAKTKKKNVLLFSFDNVAGIIVMLHFPLD